MIIVNYIIGLKCKGKFYENVYCTIKVIISINSI